MFPKWHYALCLGRLESSVEGSRLHISSNILNSAWLQALFETQQPILQRRSESENLICGHFHNIIHI